MHAPSNIDLTNPALFNQKTLSIEQANARLDILKVYVDLSRGLLSPRSSREFGELSAVFTQESAGTTIKITRQDPTEFYSVTTNRAPRNIPVIDLDSLIERKLRDPRLVLSAEESIALLSGCIERGEKEAEKARGKELCVVIGNTGAGKSTFANALFGCTMKRVRANTVPGAHSLGGSLVIVQPRSEGGALDEIMPIGHTTNSQTFIPQIETVGITLCDCPGFLDNRGYQLNTANAANIKNTFIRAMGVKIVILINFHSLKADRARGLSDMIRICCDLFGSKENLIQFQNSILLGVTQIPRVRPDEEPYSLQELKNFISETEFRDPFEQSTVRVLAQSLFIYDPLDLDDLEYDGALKKADVLKAIHNLEPIREPHSIFKTVLTPEDIAGLMEVCDETQRLITTILNRGNLTEEDFIQISHYQTGLNRLKVIEHPRIPQLLADTRAVITRHFNQMVQRFDSCCSDESFRLADEAKSVLEVIRAGIQHFDEEIRSEVHLEELRQRYDLFLKKHEARSAVIELNDLERKYRNECAEQNIPGARETLETVRQKISFFEREYALTGVSHLIRLGDLEQLFVKTSVKRELFAFQNQFMLFCRNRDFENAKECLKVIKQKVNCLNTEHGVSEGAININVLELESIYNRGIETEIEELILQFRTKCYENNTIVASNLLDQLRRRMETFYNQQQSFQKINELEQILALVYAKLQGKTNRLEELKTKFYNECNNRDIAQAESSLVQIKEKVRAFNDKYKHSGVNASSVINIPNLEKYLKNRLLFEVKEDTTHLGTRSINLKGGIDADLQAILAQNRDKEISSLWLEKCEITDRGLISLLNQCPDLASLSLFDCTQITGRSLAALSNGCAKLASLCISRCQITDSELAALSNGCAKLTNLSISECQVTDNGLANLSCTGLVTLSIYDSRMIYGSGLAALLNKCPKLEYLNLNNCALTDSALQALAGSKHQPASLNLLGSSFTEHGLAILLDKWSDLTQLNLQQTNITGSFLASVACSQNMVKLYLPHCHQLNDEKLIVLLTGWPKLTDLWLDGCIKVTPSFVSTIKARRLSTKVSY